jgi:hypothetical protein
MACSVHNHHSTSWFIALVLALLAETLAHRSNALWTNTSSTPGVGGGSSRFLYLHRILQRLPVPYVSANTTLSSWIEGTVCCLWEGVACDHVAGSVTGLDLTDRSQGINGSGLHPALFSLTSLKHLVLDGNHYYKTNIL